MSGRRGFLAFIGGLAIGGTAVQVQAAATPTLILPPKLVPASLLPGELPLLHRHETRLDALIKVYSQTPTAQFNAWLEAGLRMVEAHGGAA